MDRGRELSDEQWAAIGPLMPQVSGRSRPWRDHRRVVEGTVHRYRTGVAWRDLPERFGPWQTVWKRHARFSRDETWDKILTALQARADANGGRSRGGLSTKIHAAVDGNGRPLAVLVGPGRGRGVARPG
ncbi:transposase [Cellulosimicrobium cellulans]|nr:transposase [Cellulosimicrobium cellulans]